MFYKLKIFLKTNELEYSDDMVQLSDEGKGVFISKWEYDIPTPTMEQLDTITEAEVKLANYATLRTYPPIGEQLDALWKGGQDAEDMKAQIQAVKDKYPKS